MKMPLYLGQPGPQVGWAEVDADGNILTTIFPESELPNFAQVLFKAMQDETIKGISAAYNDHEPLQ